MQPVATEQAPIHRLTQCQVVAVGVIAAWVWATTRMGQVLSRCWQLLQCEQIDALLSVILALLKQMDASGAMTLSLLPIVTCYGAASMSFPLVTWACHCIAFLGTAAAKCCACLSLCASIVLHTSSALHTPPLLVPGHD